MLQEAVDAVLDNGRHGRAVTGPGNRALKSLSEILKGKTGRFRQNLLGKRVDYSGRSVIVVGPELKFPQCGIPKEMALRLFEPFIIRRLKEIALCQTVRTARKMIERQDPKVWDILEEVTKDKTVFLNRAPTLHRLSIQAFEPVLVEGKAIRLHPMVCTPFNADFDGDQMAVHVPLSVEAQMESKLMMLATTSIFSPASGKSIVTPTQDVCLGLYYLTVSSQQDKLAGKIAGKTDMSNEHLPLFNDIGEVEFGIAEGCIGYHTRIRFRNPDYGTKGRPHGDPTRRTLETTAGRVIFNNVWPEEMGFWNDKCSKSTIGKLILDCHKVAGHEITVEAVDTLKTLGYKFATISGASMGLKDMIRPEEKDAEIAKARKEADKVQSQFQQGIITEGERHNKIVDIWAGTTEKIGELLYKTIDRNVRPDNRNPTELNPVYMFADSKARGSKLQIRQLAGMRGLMSNPSGDIIERPITASFREGLSVLEYFISSHGARKGLADTALKTADAGYLTRKLVDVSQDVIVTQEDCNTVNGIEVEAIIEGDEVKVSLGDRVLGRTALYAINDPKTGEEIVPANEIINEDAADRINKVGLESVWIRSGLTCDAEHGMCAKCYGRDLSTGKQVEIGTAVGIIAAQSIGEPGTQLTMRTFHIGGTASATAAKPEIILKNDGIAKFVDVRKVRNDEGREVVLNKNGSLEIYSSTGSKLDTYQLQMGTVLLIEDGASVKKGAKAAEWDPHSVPVLSEASGKIQFVDFEEDISVKTETDRATGAKTLVVLPTSESNLHPRIEIRGADDKMLDSHDVPTGAIVMVRDGMKATPGMLLAKTPREAAKTRDITGGLPRVAELFEARRPKDAAEIAKIEGVIDISPENVRGKRCVKVVDSVTGLVEEHLIPMGKQIVVFKGDKVKKGQPLTEGPVIPEEILEVSGPQELEKYLVNEVQQVYRLQGVEINDKHIEIIVRQMLRKVRITNPGDTDFLWGEQVTRQSFLRVNEDMMNEGRRPAEAQPALLGITKAALETDSFISAASFQDTTRVLTEAATMGRVDELRGFKENVILGHLIPGGTGFPLHRYIKLVPLAETISDEEMDALHEEQRKRNEEIYGLSKISGEEEDDESDLVDPVIMQDNGDTSADGADFLTADEVVDGGDDLLG
jgi:DNA-directed RNA polymerase subunit beta'